MKPHWMVCSAEPFNMITGQEPNKDGNSILPDMEVKPFNELQRSTLSGFRSQRSQNEFANESRSVFLLLSASFHFGTVLI